MGRNYISKNFTGSRYYTLPQIDSYMKDSEWKVFTILFNHIMTITNHDTIHTKPIEITHSWISKRIGKSTKQSQRIIADLEDIGIIIVRRATQKSNRYQLDWDCINELAESQLEDLDKNVSDIEDIDVLGVNKNVSCIEDIDVLELDNNVSSTGDRNVSLRINKIKRNKKINKSKNTVSTGTITKSKCIPAIDLADIPEKVLSLKEDRLASARKENHNLQYLGSALAASHPPVPRTPLSQLEQNARNWADKLYYHYDNYTAGDLEYYVTALSNTLKRERDNFTAETISKMEAAIAFVEHLLR